MDKVTHGVPLSSAEMANLWTQYMNDSLSICILTHAIEKAKDKEIKELLQFALKIAESHIVNITNIFNEESFPIPKGFSVDEDVNLNVPPLFTDTFMLVYMHVMTLLGLTAYAGAVSTSTRADQIDYYINCNKETMELYQRIVKLMHQKEAYSQPPRISKPRNIEFVNDQRYLSGWFGKKRPLSAVEISGININMQKIIIKVVLEMGFGQVCRTKEVKKYFQRGRELCQNQFETLSSTLTESNLTSPASWISEVTDSTESPFSDKLMLNHIVYLVSAAIGYFGAGVSVSQRRDLSIEYTRLIAEIGLYAEDGAQLLIKYGWLEQPPLANDREYLANKI